MINFYDVNAVSNPLASDRLLGKIARLPLKMIPKKAVLPILQGPGRGLKWIVGSYNHGCWLGSYEYEKQVVIPGLVKPGDVVYDVGAHVGYFTIIFAKLVGPAGQVAAFEPFPQNHAYIQRHVALNGFSNVKAIEAGVGARTETAYFEAGWHEATGRRGEKGDFSFQVYSLQDAMAKFGLKWPTLIKMDIEGEEARVIPALADELARRGVTLLISTHSNDITRDLSGLLSSKGYGVTPLQWSNRPAVRTPENATLILAKMDK